MRFELFMLAINMAFTIAISGANKCLIIGTKQRSCTDKYCTKPVFKTTRCIFRLWLVVRYQVPFCGCADPIRDGRRCIVMSSLIGWVHTQNDPCVICQSQQPSPLQSAAHLLPYTSCLKTEATSCHTQRPYNSPLMYKSDYYITLERPGVRNL